MYKTRIEITTLDGFSDVVITDSRPKQIGLHNVDLVTDNFYRTLASNDYKQQQVQSITWNKYKIEFIAKEDYYLEHLRFAKEIKIFRYNNSLQHDAVVINVSRELAGDDFSHIIVEYYDKNLSNYVDGKVPVYNFLRSDAWKERGGSLNNINILRLQQGTDIYDWVSPLLIDPTAAQPSAQSFDNTQDGATVATNMVIKNKYDLVFYLNADDIVAFQSVLPLADGHNVRAWYFAGNTTKYIKEPPQVTVEMLQGFNIYKASVSFVYEIINFYSYGDN